MVLVCPCASSKPIKCETKITLLPLRIFRLFVAAATTVFVFPGSLKALDPARSITQYTHRIWDQEEGLFQPTVYSILQSHDGFLWLGTQDSLIRFDGLRFHEFDDSPRSVLHRALVRSLLEDGAGNLWAGTIGSGLVRISPQSVATRFAPSTGFPGVNAFCLDRGDGNDIWVCANDSLVRYHNGRFNAFGTAQGLPAAIPRATCSTPSGVRWVATEAGLASLSNDRISTFSNTSVLPDGEPINALRCDESGVVWAGTNRGLLRIAGKESRLLAVRDGLPDNAVLTLAGGSHRSLWVGTNDGVSRVRDGRLSVYRTRDGLSHSLVLSLFEDREESLWAGTKNGLDQFTDGVVTPFTTEEGLSDNDAGPLVEDAKGRIWAGTLGGGINVFDNGRFRALTRRDGLLSDDILSLVVTPDGDLWAGTAGGVNQIRNDKVIHSYTARQGLSANKVRSLVVDADGTLWAGTDKGVDRWSGTRFAPAGLWPEKKAPGIVALFAGQQVKLFISTAEPAMQVYRDGKLTSYTPDANRPADCLFLDREHHESWIGTLGTGLLRWKNGVFKHVRVKDGLYDNRIYGILRDDARNFWLASSKGIFRVSEAELDDFADGRIQFVNSIPFTTGQLRFECQSGVQPAAIRTRDGRLWFSTTNGLVTVNPRDLSARRLPPPTTSVQAVLVNGQPVPTSAIKAGVHLSPLERNVEILYAGLSFLSPEKLTFRYTLSGFDRDQSWTDAGTRREVFFTNLPPGRFTFKVQSRNPDGEWGKEAARLPFTIEPRLYQRVWFFPALAVMVALLVMSFYRLRIRNLQRGFDMVISERSRIARELHDTLLQGLSGITMQLQAVWMKLPSSKEKQWLGDIIKDASRASTEARQSLWGLRSPQLSATGFHDKLAKTVRQAAAGSTVAVKLELEPVSLAGAPDAEFQLLRIAGEAAANAVAHSGASQLVVSLRVQRKTLHLRLADDGIGFDTSAAQPFGHYGLTGMRERAAEIKARLSIESAPGAGSVVLVVLPLAAANLLPSDESNPAPTHAHHTE